RHLGDLLGESEEVLVLGDEVGLGIDLDQHGLVASLRQHDAALGGDATGLLVGLGQAGLAEELHGGVDVAGVLGERLLALHHAGAGALAQFLDLGGGDLHVVTSNGSARRVAAGGEGGSSRGRQAARRRSAGWRVRGPASDVMAYSAEPASASAGLASADF